MINQYQERQGVRDYLGAFDILDLFYESLTRKPKAEVRETWEKYKADKAAIIMSDNPTYVRRMANYTSAVSNFLQRNNNRVYGEFIAALDKFGYFEEVWGAVPRNPQPKHIGEEM